MISCKFVARHLQLHSYRSLSSVIDFHSSGDIDFYRSGNLLLLFAFRLSYFMFKYVSKQSLSLSIIYLINNFNCYTLELIKSKHVVIIVTILVNIIIGNSQTWIRTIFLNSYICRKIDEKYREKSKCALSGKLFRANLFWNSEGPILFSLKIKQKKRT